RARVHPHPPQAPAAPVWMQARCPPPQVHGPRFWVDPRCRSRRSPNTRKPRRAAVQVSSSSFQSVPSLDILDEDAIVHPSRNVARLRPNFGRQRELGGLNLIELDLAQVRPLIEPRQLRRFIEADAQALDRARLEGIGLVLQLVAVGVVEGIERLLN